MPNVGGQFECRDEFAAFIAKASESIDKSKLIVDVCRGKDVLDIGCIDHSYTTALELGEEWLHRKITQSSKSTIGLDILKADAEVLNGLGYNIVVGDAERFSIGRTFDAIVGGDIIEHLSNIGLFLDCVRMHMHAESQFIVTTPNPFNFEQVMQAVFNRQVVVNKQHTVWLDPVVMWQLLNRHGFAIVDFRWIDTRFRNYVWSTRWSRIVNRLIDAAHARVPLLRRDFAIIAKLSADA